MNKWKPVIINKKGGSMHSHNHDHSHGHQMEKNTLSNLIVAFSLNLIFAGIEFVGGLLSGSITLMTDAIHDLGDSLVILSGIFFQLLSNKKRNEQYTYGYRRYGLLGALLTVVILVISSLIMFNLAFERFLNPQPVDVGIVLIIGFFGLLANGISIWRMSKSNAMMDRAMLLHLLEDLFGWVAAIIGAILIYFFEIYRIDAIIAMFLSVVIFINALRKSKEILNIFLQKIPDNIDYLQIEKIIGEFEFVQEVVDLHIWGLEGEDIILTCQVVVGPEGLKDAIEKKEDVKRRLENEGINHATIELAFEGNIQECFID